MKDQKHLYIVGEIDDRFVEEAAPVRHRAPWRRLTASLVAACLLLAVMIPGGFYLFTPFDTSPPDVSGYADSAYYPIITRLNSYSFQAPAYKNNFELIADNFGNNLGSLLTGGHGGDSPSFAPSVEGNDGGYKEVTDNQVEGVIEADFIKRTSEHIFYMYRGELRVYSIAGEESTLVGYYSTENQSLQSSYGDGRNYEMFLSEDGNTLSVIAGFGSASSTRYTEILSLDVSDPTSIREKGRFSVSGSYSTARSVNGKILLITEYYPRMSFEDAIWFVPSIDRGNGLECLPLDSIHYPDELTSDRYTVICQVDEATLAYEGGEAFLSYAEELYVSGEHIYATRSFTKLTPTENEKALHERMTEISCLAYGEDGFSHRGSVTVAGQIKNQYSMDEYEGVLRAVTSTNTITLDYDENGRKAYEVYGVLSFSLPAKESANLYCIDIATWEILGEVIGFAPQGERVESARFDGKNAYVCTAEIRTLTDPVFFFDLSDPANITYTDTGVIEGYSSSLVNLGDGYLLGIGTGSVRGILKIEVYREEGERVVSVCSYEIPNCTFSSDYKAYYIDRENGLIGLGVIDYSYTTDKMHRYLLLRFEDGALHELLKPQLAGHPDFQRGVYIDGYFYIFGMDQYKVLPLSLAE